MQNFGGLQALPGSQRSQKPRLQHYLRRNVWRVAMNEKCVRCAVAVSALSAAPLADPPSRREQYCECMGHLAIHLRPGPPTGPRGLASTTKKRLLASYDCCTAAFDVHGFAAWGRRRLRFEVCTFALCCALFAALLVRGPNCRAYNT